MNIFSPDRRSLCFFTVHSWTMKPRLLMKNFPWTLMKAGRVQCRFNFMFPNTFQERVLLEQVNRTYSHSFNKLPENYSLSVHCPLMNQLWATHDFLVFEIIGSNESSILHFLRRSQSRVGGNKIPVIRWRSITRALAVTHSRPANRSTASQTGTTAIRV